MKKDKEVIGIVHDYPVTTIIYDPVAIEHNRRASRVNRLFLFIGLIILYSFTLFLFWLGIKTALHYGEGWGAIKLLLLGIVWHILQTIIVKVIWDAT